MPANRFLQFIQDDFSKLDRNLWQCTEDEGAEELQLITLLPHTVLLPVAWQGRKDDDYYIK